MGQIKKFLKSESGISTYLAGVAFGFVAGNFWKSDSGGIDWWLTITFLIILVAASSYYIRGQKGKK